MKSRSRATLDDLRLAIQGLPRATRVAMLRGIDANRIIVGAYASSDGICPMLAAHRAGGRTASISFAEAWDRFAFRGVRATRARRATERELLTLRAHLEASLLDEVVWAAGPEEVKPSPSAGIRHRPDPGGADRTRELRRRPGWAWSGLVHGYDEYERLLRRLQDERRATEHDEPAAGLRR